MDWALIVAIIALVVAVMALPTVFQMIWGKPKLKIDYDNMNGYRLWIKLQNVPITNKFLAAMGVNRNSLDIRSIWISIRSKSDNELGPFDVYYGDTTYKDIRKLTLGNARSSHITLLASPLTANIDVAGIRTMAEGKVFVINELGKYDQVLSVGLYTLELAFMVNGVSREIEKDFRVNQTKPFVEWME